MKTKDKIMTITNLVTYRFILTEQCVLINTEYMSTHCKYARPSTAA